MRHEKSVGRSRTVDEQIADIALAADIYDGIIVPTHETPVGALKIAELLRKQDMFEAHKRDHVVTGEDILE